MKTKLLSVAVFSAIGALCTPAFALEPQANPPAAAYVKITKQINPHFPPRLLRRGVTHGEAVTSISIDASGKIVDWLVSRYTHKEFADAAVNALKQWEFTPLQGVGVVMDVTFIYRIDGVVAVERFGGETTANLAYQDYTYRPCPPKELDKVPALKHRVTPTYPEEFEKQGITGSALVKFYIDESGRTRLAVPIAADNSILGGLATAAVDQWQFEPPTRAGKPVLVEVTQRFAFQPKGK